MFERFTQRARQAVVYAQEEAERLAHDYVGTEHLLLGVLRVEDGLAARVLADLGVDADTTRAEVERIVGRGVQQARRPIPFTPRARTVLDLALRAALQLGHKYIGTEHVLLGLVREGEGVGAAILRERGATAKRVEEAVLAGLAGAGRPSSPWPRGPRRRPARPPHTASYDVRPLEGAPDTWSRQLNGWAAEGWSLHTVVRHDGQTVAVLVRRR